MYLIAWFYVDTVIIWHASSYALLICYGDVLYWFVQWSTITITSRTILQSSKYKTCKHVWCRLIYSYIICLLFSRKVYTVRYYKYFNLRQLTLVGYRIREISAQQAIVCSTGWVKSLTEWISESSKTSNTFGWVDAMTSKLCSFSPLLSIFLRCCWIKGSNTALKYCIKHVLVIIRCLVRSVQM